MRFFVEPGRRGSLSFPFSSLYPPFKRTAEMPGTRTLFYQPTAKQVSSAPDTRFRLYLNDKLGLQLRDFHELREWTLDHLNEFWTAVWDYTRVIGKRTWVFKRESGREGEGCRVDWLPPSPLLTEQWWQGIIRWYSTYGYCQSSIDQSQRQLRRGTSSSLSFSHSNQLKQLVMVYMY